MTVVIIVLEVARDARDIHLVVERILAVAVAAGQLRMPSIPGETRVARVIELRIFPAGRRVAVAAILSAAPVMGVVLGVAVETGGRRCLECLILVATRALGFCVLADQREAGRVVIELDVGPGDRRMAVGALRTHRDAMNIVRFVAGKAL